MEQFMNTLYSSGILQVKQIYLLILGYCLIEIIGWWKKRNGGYTKSFHAFTVQSRISFFGVFFLIPIYVLLESIYGEERRDFLVILGILLMCFILSLSGAYGVFKKQIINDKVNYAQSSALLHSGLLGIVGTLIYTYIKHFM